MPPARERTNPKTGASDNRRDALVRAAAQLFREKGFEGTTIRDIAGAVGMQSGSPFYHFANKHELLMAVMEEGLRLGLERTHAVVDAEGLTPVERFRRLVRAHYGILHETGSDFIPVMLYDWRSLPAPYRRRIVELKDRYDALWQTTLDALHAEGRLGADARIARLMILGAINFSATWYRPRPPNRAGVDLDTLAAETTALFLREAPP
jgi:TetR/AcrR family transcriptional regulator, cholesterol catabolism regulator